MTWSPLFDRIHIIKGVPVDTGIELECRKCIALCYTCKPTISAMQTSLTPTQKRRVNATTA